MDLLPNSKGVFYMSNMSQSDSVCDVKRYHKVRFTYDFWISKHLVNVDHWREFSPSDCENCVDIEKDIGGEYPIVKFFPFHSVTSYCGYLTRKYKSQIPDGYVFRLPTEAELEYATVGTSDLWVLKSREYGVNKYGACGKDAHEKMDDLRRRKRLDKYGTWNIIFLNSKKAIVAGLACPFPTGIVDVWNPGIFVADRLGAIDAPVNYADEEVDPLHWVGAEDMDGICYCRSYVSYRSEGSCNDRHTFHFVVAPAIDKFNKYDETAIRSVRQATKNIPNRKYNFSVPKKVSHPKEIAFRLANGANMIFNACPAGKFDMSSVPGQEEKLHEVRITRPFWMTKYNVTIEQWEDFASNEYPGLYKKIQKAFSQYPVSVAQLRGCWSAYCDYLTCTYGHLIPKGYVFRLPSEAEWEYAFRGGERKDAVLMNDVGSSARRCREEFAKMLKKHKDIDKLGKWYPACFFCEGRASVYVGGRAKPHKWGFHDMWLVGRGQMTLDTFDYECNEWSGKAAKHIVYENKARDPLFWAGDSATRGIMRQNAYQRFNIPLHTPALARIVIGPDLVKEKVSKNR